MFLYIYYLLFIIYYLFWKEDFFMINTYNSISGSTNRGISGLASGMDTDAIVKGMTAHIHARIAKQLQARQLTAWRIDAFRNITNKMINFNNRFLSFTSNTNALSRAFYNINSVVATGANAGAVTVTGSAGAANMSITDIVSYATTANFMTTKNPSPDKIVTSEIEFEKVVNNAAGETVYIIYGGEEYALKFDENFSGSDNDAVKAEFQRLLDTTNLKGDSGAMLSSVIGFDEDSSTHFFLKVKNPDGTINTNGSVSIDSGTGTILSSLNLTSVQRTGADGVVRFHIQGRTDVDRLVVDLTIKKMGEDERFINFNLNGATRSVYLPKYDGTDIDEYVDLFQQEMDKVFGQNRILVENDNGAMSFSTVRRETGTGLIVPDTTSTLTIVRADSDVVGDKGIFGMEVGASNRLSLNQPLSSITTLQSQTITLLDEKGEPVKNTQGVIQTVQGYKLNINGKDVIISENTTLSGAIDQINRANTGLKVSYMPTTGKFNVTASEQGENGKVELNDISGNFVSMLFGISDGADRTALQARIDELQLEIDEYQLEIDDIQADIDALGIDALKDKIAEIENLNKKMADIEALNEAITKLTEEINTTIPDQITVSTGELGTLTSDLGILTGQLVNLEIEKDALEIEVQDLEDEKLADPTAWDADPSKELALIAKQEELADKLAEIAEQEAKVAEKQAELDEKQDEIDALNTALIDKQDELDEKEAELLDLNVFSSDEIALQDRLDDVAELKEKINVITTLEQEIADLEAIVNDPNYLTVIADLTQEITDLEDEETDLDLEIQALELEKTSDPAAWDADPDKEAELVAKQEELTALQDEITSKQDELNKLTAAPADLLAKQADLAANPDVLADLEADLAALFDSDLAALKQELADKNAEASPLLAKIADREAEIAIRETEIAMREADIQNINDGNVYTINTGTDAEILIRYGTGQEQVVKRNSNQFSIDGLNITLNPEVTFEPGVPIVFQSKSNADNVVANIKEMIEAYNDIMATVNKDVKTRPNRNFQPLTDEQKKEMTENQIKEWEDKAKQGLLFSDPMLLSLANEMRFIFSNPQMVEIGITTSRDYNDSGKIMINEERLRLALESDPDGVEEIFIGTNGAMPKVKAVVDKYASTLNQSTIPGRVYRGALIERAGLADSATEQNNDLYRRIIETEKAIENLQRSLAREEARYYRQFAALETYLARMSQQSAWMQQQFMDMQQ